MALVVVLAGLLPVRCRGRVQLGDPMRCWGRVQLGDPMRRRGRVQLGDPRLVTADAARRLLVAAVVMPGVSAAWRSMAPRVDFYTTDDARPEAAARLLCRVIEKAYKQGLKVYVHTPTPRRARFFDELLWTFRPGSFVPHELCNGSGSGSGGVPVRIGSGTVVRGDASVLCNLSPEPPPSLDGFERLVDVADGREPDRSAGRARFRWYKGQALALTHHPI